MGIYANTNGTLTPLAGGVSNSYAPIGAIYPYGGSSAPSGYLMCDGSAVSRTDYSALFAVIGTSFGAGDGSTTFNIPDLRGEFLRGAGTNSHTGQGNGGSVGEHQDATENPNVLAHLNNNWVGGYVTGGSMTSNPVKKPDKNIKSGNAYTVYANSSSFSSPEAIEYYTSRPTNTSVNFIIKAKDVNLSVGGQALADRVETLEEEINPTLAATFTAENGIKSGGVTVQGCKKIGDGLAVVTGYINKNTVLTVHVDQSNIGRLGITGHTSVGTNPTSIFLWSQGHSPQSVSTVWKVTGGWLAVPWEDGDYTLTEDAWFNAVIRYN